MLSERRQRRARAQRGSVLSSVLVIVAFLSILGGALMSEISTQFLLSHIRASRVADEATVNSSVEYAIGQLQIRTVPVHCSTDTGPKWSVNLNGKWATATPSCLAIVPDRATPLTAGAFAADGTHVVIGGRDTYLVGDSSGNVYNYPFGQTAYLWRVMLGAGVTGPPSQSLDATRPGHLITLIPAGNAVALIDDHVGAGASSRCNMAAGGSVTSQPGVEHPPSGSAPYFPDYAFFGDVTGRLWVYDATTNGSCAQMARASGLGGAVVGGPLVLKGTRTITRNQGGENGEQDTTTTTVELFAVVKIAGSRGLVQYEYSEVDDGSGRVTRNLNFIASQSLPITNVVGVAYSSTTPAKGQSIRLAITAGSGQVAMPAIAVQNSTNGLTYTMSPGPAAVALGGTFRRAAFWCHCPGGVDLIGAGNQNGTLYVLNANNLTLRYRYDGSAADGRPQINSTPGADANGDWYFGADDGFVYDVEPPASGTLMFKAARFGPGGSVRSSPVVGSPSDGCAPGPCMYFGSTGTDYFAQLGSLRLMNVTACLTASSGSATCNGNPRLWARLQVGTSGIVGGQDVSIVGWSYYSP
jgi:outer membrane protein assembly factor BamB